MMDNAIDEVAREMTSAAPDAGLARRVMTAIASGEGERTRATLWRPLWKKWILAPAAAMCALAIAVFVARDNPAPIAPATPVVRLKPDATTKATPNAATPAAVQAARTLPAPAVTIEPLRLDAIDIQPLARSEQIEINAIAIEHIEISAMP